MRFKNPLRIWMFKKGKTSNMHSLNKYNKKKIDGVGPVGNRPSTD